MEIDDIRRIEFKPGDKLVLRLSRPISADGAERLLEHFSAFAPGVQVLILEPGMSLDVLSELAA